MHTLLGEVPSLRFPKCSGTCELMRTHIPVTAQTETYMIYLARVKRKILQGGANSVEVFEFLILCQFAFLCILVSPREILPGWCL